MGLDVRVTRAAGHASELAADGARGGASLVVAAGGDGTIHEVVAGLLSQRESPPALGVVPLGTGNDFARNLGIPLDPMSALSQVHDEGRDIDITRLTLDGRSDWCVNALNGGFSGQVAEAVTAEMKERWGRLSYLRAATASLTDLVTYDIHLSGHGDEPETSQGYNLAIANGPAIGGGFPIAPEADPTDGMVDLVVVKPAPVARLTTLLPAVLGGQEPESELFQSWRLRKGSIRIDPPLPFSLDGDLQQAARIEFQVAPAALHVRGATLA